MATMASVVIIEDEQRIRELVARVLADRGHDVESTATAMEGLQAVVRVSPQLVILDMGLPDLDGAELLKMIRAVSDVPIIVATARSEDRDVIRTLDAGADDYLVKPFSVDQLEARVRAVLRRSGSRGKTSASWSSVIWRSMSPPERPGWPVSPYRSEPQGIRRPAIPRRASRRGCLEAGVARRGMAAAVWRERENR